MLYILVFFFSQAVDPVAMALLVVATYVCCVQEVTRVPVLMVCSWSMAVTRLVLVSGAESKQTNKQTNKQNKNDIKQDKHR